MDWFWAFPHLDDDILRTIRMTIDDSFRNFTRAWGDPIQQLFEPLRLLLVFAEWVMLNAPWPIIILAVGIVAWLASRRWQIVVGSIATLLLIGYFAPHEGSATTAYGVYNIDSLAAYEAYRARLAADPLGRVNYEFARDKRFILKEDRIFLKLASGPRSLPAKF